MTDDCTIFATNNKFMAKSSTRRVTIYINGKEEDASGWQTFSYGKLSEVTENIPIFAPASRTQTQTTPNPICT